MKKPKPKSDAIYVRVTPDTKKRFAEVAARYEETPSDVLRELVQAFIEDRVTIMPPKVKKESLYNVSRTED